MVLKKTPMIIYTISAVGKGLKTVWKVFDLYHCEGGKQIYGASLLWKSICS